MPFAGAPSGWDRRHYGTTATRVMGPGIATLAALLPNQKAAVARGHQQVGSHSSMYSSSAWSSSSSSLAPEFSSSSSQSRS